MQKLFLFILISFNFVDNEIMPRFDMRDPFGIIFDPIVPRAGQKYPMLTFLDMLICHLYLYERILAKCSIVGRSPENIKSVSWNLNRQNDGKQFFLALNTMVFQFTTPIQRLHAFHDIEANDWYLLFDPLDRDDIGNLSCSIADTGNEVVNISRFLDVHSEPVILESSTKDIEVDIGESVTLTCLSQGYPSPNISWLRADGKPLPNGHATHRGSELKIQNIKKDDRGIYICQSSNLIGFGAIWSLKLAVRFSPSVSCQRAVGQAPNFEVDAYMECYASGYPPPRLSWYKEMDPSNPNALMQLTEKTFKYKFEATIPEPDVCTDCILARITVINVISSDYGTYVLRASSEQFSRVMGQDKVKLYETPECQQSISNPDNKGCRSPPKIISP